MADNTLHAASAAILSEAFGQVIARFSEQFAAEPPHELAGMVVAALTYELIVRSRVMAAASDQDIMEFVSRCLIETPRFWKA